METPGRTRSHARIATELSSLSNRKLLDLLEGSSRVYAGIGGTATVLEIDRTPVFVKRIPVTDLELQSDHYMSTANFSNLPLWCLYRLATPTFGVWRELLVHVMCSNWVVGEELTEFPLLYHWRCLSGSNAVPMGNEETSELEQNIRAWGDPPALRERFDAMQRATTEVLIFLEHLPQNLYQWLRETIARDGDDATPSILEIEGRLHQAIGRMNAQGLFHMDAHFENILTDGNSLYFTDFGLALSRKFEMSSEEADFFAQHRGYDRCNLIMSFAQVVVMALWGDGQWAEKLTHFLEGRLETGKTRLAQFLRRQAPVALALREFFMDVLQDVWSSSFPTDKFSHLLAEFDEAR